MERQIADQFEVACSYRLVAFIVHCVVSRKATLHFLDSASKITQRHSC